MSLGTFFCYISPNMLSSLENIIINDEIKEALFSIPDDNTPNLDGYTSLFFKRS
jgi:hypothetical protein